MDSSTYLRTSAANSWYSLRMMNVIGLDAPPPGPCVKTVMAFEAGTARLLPVTVTFKWLLSTNTVGRLRPFSCPTEPWIKFCPVMVICKSLLAAPWLNTHTGLMLVSDGTALLPGCATVNDTAFDVPPPGPPVNTVTLETPGWLTSDCAMATCRCPLLTKVVARLAPFQRTVEPLIKPAPYTSSVSPLPPDSWPCGVILVMDGTGLCGEAVGSTTKFFGKENWSPPAGSTVSIWITGLPALAIIALVIVASSS